MEVLFTFINSKLQERLNLKVFEISRDIGDFLALHYRGQRRDTDFWKSHAYDEGRIPTSLKEKLEAWGDYFNKGKIDPLCAGYAPSAWLMVLQGLSVFNTEYIKKSIGPDVISTGLEIFRKTEDKYTRMVDPYYTIEEWVKKQQQS